MFECEDKSGPKGYSASKMADDCKHKQHTLLLERYVTEQTDLLVGEVCDGMSYPPQHKTKTQNTTAETCCWLNKRLSLVESA